MKKKLIILLLSLISVVCLAFGISACDSASGGQSGSSSDTEQSQNGSTTHTHTLTYYAAVDATCKSTGNIEYWYCAGCGKYFSDNNGTTEISQAKTVTAKLAHTAGETIKENEIAATCGANGSYDNVVYCSVCDEEISRESITVLATGKHTSGEAVKENEIEPTCGITGSYDITVRCTICNTLISVKRVTVPATGIHTIVTDEAVAATCTSTGLTEGSHCSVCNTVIVAQEVTDKLEHTIVTDEAVAATCTSTGLTEGSHCSVCNTVIVAQEVTDKLEHTIVTDEAVAATCTSTGLTEGSYCSVCNTVIVAQEVTDKLEHTIVIDEAVAATCTSTGLTEGSHCSVCGEIFIAQEIVSINDNHSYNESGICTLCGAKKPSEGLYLTLSTNEKYYIVSGIGDCTDTEIVIPSKYNDLPVTQIAENAFKNQTQLISVYVSNSINFIGGGAFGGCSSLTDITLPFVGESEDSTNSWSLFGYIFGSSSYTGGTSTKQYFDSSNYITYYIPTSLTTVTIKRGKIPYGAFYNCDSLINITIPDNSTSIGSYAFYGCKSLTNFTIPDNITIIDSCVFYNCTSLKNVTIPNSVYYIAGMAFYNCSSLESIEIPISITTVGVYAFSGCTKLTNIYYNGTASQWANITLRNVSSNPLYNGGNLYLGGTLATDIKIEGITTIKAYTFYNCDSIASITIGDSVTSIGESAFYGCILLTNITIPSSVTNISSNAFQGCYKIVEIYNLSSIRLAISSTDNGYIAYYAKNIYTTTSGESHLINEDGYLFVYDSDNNYYLVSYTGNDTEITLPSISINKETVDYSILEYSFYNNTEITSVVIPSSVTTIGSAAFSGCSSLESITLPFVGGSATDNTYLGYIFGANSYSYNSSYVPSSLTTVIITGGTSIGSYAFYNCSSVTSITIPESTQSIEDYAFNGCTSLTKINNEINGIFVIPENVISIGISAFKNCTMLTSIVIPDGVTSIGSAAFSGCSSLESITLPFVGGNANATEASSSTLFGYIFGTSNYTGGTSTKQYYTNSNYSYYYIPAALTTVTITGGNIMYGAFYSCSNLTNISLLDNITSIGSYSFIYCTSLKNISIPNNVASIETCAFYGCTSLNSVTLGSGVTSIGSFAFRGCTSLTSITIPNSVESIGSNSFYDCESLESVTIGSSVKTIGEYAFSCCYLLTSITIPNSVTSIDMYAFRYCTKLENVTFENTNGWYRTSVIGATSGTDIDVSDTSQNATYLTSSFVYYWYRSEN